MAPQGGLFGAGGILEQLFLWNVAGQLVGALTSPAMTAIQQDMNAKHPELALTPEVAAEAVAKHMLTAAAGAQEAARGGLDSGRWATLARLAEVRLSPDVLAQAVERHMLGEGAAAAEAQFQGITKQWFDVLLAMAKVHLQPDILAQAVERGIMGEGAAAGEAHLQGLDAGQFAVLRSIAQLRIDPGTLAQAVTHNLLGQGPAASEAKLQGMAPGDFHTLLGLQTVRLSPATLAEAVQHNLEGNSPAEKEAHLQGITPEQWAVLRNIATVRLPPQTLAQAVEHNLEANGPAEKEAHLQGITTEQWQVLRELERVRLQPADLAEAVLRSYLTEGQALAEAKPQGVTPEMLKVLSDLAGDAPGPDQLVLALLRKIIPAHGKGAGSVSYEQGIAETRLHNKWGPVLEELGHPPLSPADAASAVIRNFVTDHEGIAQAGKSGVTPELFAILTHLAGDAPGPQQLAEALRRHLIPLHGKGPQSVSFQQGIAEGRLADKWSPVIEGLAKLWPTPVDALAAALKGQVTKEEGKHLYELLGGDLQFYTWLLDSQGEGPTPLEAADWARRGIIPVNGTGPEVTSYEQAVKESRFRDKWAKAYRESAVYLPSPETVRVLLEQGAFTEKQAVQFWRKSGLDEETISAYIDAARFNDTAATRGLAVSEILDMVYAQVIGDEEAKKLIHLFRVPEHTATLLLAYTKVRREVSAVTQAVRRVQSLVAGRKISLATAREALNRLRIPGSVIQDLVSTWDLEARISVKVLTEAQIVDAFQIGIYNQQEAIAELDAIGYTPFDAWTLLSIKMKTPLPNKPAREVAPSAGPPVPGVT